MARRTEPLSQRDLVYVLRVQIDQAMRRPSKTATAAAIRIALEHARAMRSEHVIHNLGQERMEWLERNGGLVPNESTDIAGQDAIKTTITPDITKGPE